MSAHISSITYPPHELVKRFFSMPLPGETMNVLDAGCHTGRNARYAASLGHRVIGLSLDPEEIKVAKTQSHLSNLAYTVGDILSMPFRQQFDVVMLNEVLQDIEVSERVVALRAIQKQTAIGGYNIVSAYAGNRESAVDRFELYDAYNGLGWHIVSCHTDTEIQLPGTNQLASKASIIAVREL